MKVIITGTTGMVGRSVLNECLRNQAVSEILIINRRSLELDHPKLKEIIHKDFFNLEPIASQLKGYEACFFCLGVSAVGMSQEQYEKMTYELTVHFAECVLSQNPEMVFNYVSGTGTDSTEEGRTHWARIKGKTENKIFRMGFKDAYAIRLGALIPEDGIQSATAWYRWVYVLMRPFFLLLKKLDSMITSSNLGKAMIATVLYPQNLKLLENKDLNHLAKML